jgi:hypothetical protein
MHQSNLAISPTKLTVSKPHLISAVIVIIKIQVHRCYSESIFNKLLCLSKAAVNKCLDENCTFPNKRTKKYFFICIKGVAVCTVCNENISVLKEYSIKRYYEIKHGSQLRQTGPVKSDKITRLQNRLVQQQQSSFLSNRTLDAVGKLPTEGLHYSN